MFGEEAPTTLGPVQIKAEKPLHLDRLMDRLEGVRENLTRINSKLIGITSRVFGEQPFPPGEKDPGTSGSMLDELNGKINDIESVISEIEQYIAAINSL